MVSRVKSEKVADGIRRQMVVGENVMVCRFTFDPFVVTDVHTHPHEQVTMVMAGKVKFTVEGKSVMLEEYARQMIFAEEMHAGEVDKMLRRPGELAVAVPDSV